MNIRLSTGAKIAVYIFLAIMVFITVVPLLYVASASFKPNLEILAGGEVPALHVMEGGIITVNTDTAKAIGVDYSAFSSMANTLNEVITAE